MDLIERQGPRGARHPWETARAVAIQRLLRRLELVAPRTLDIGCGDGFLLGELKEALSLSEAVAQDIHLSDAIVSELQQPGVEYVRQLSQLGERRFDLILLLDVLEHVHEPSQLLAEVWQRHLDSRGRVLITVPAFQSLFTQHDRDLQHFRRYSRREIGDVARQAGLRVEQSGYLFSSLLVPRALSALREKLALRSPSRRGIGVGGWRSPALVSRFLHEALCLDTRTCLWAQSAGVTIPGLSAWLLCSER